MDIVICDIWFIRICPNGLAKLWPLERAQYGIVLGKHTFKEFLSGQAFIMTCHIISIFSLSLNLLSGCNHKTEMGKVM